MSNFDFSAIFRDHATDISHEKVEQEKVAQMIRVILNHINTKMCYHQDYYNNNGRFGHTLDKLTISICPSFVVGLDKYMFNDNFAEIEKALVGKYGKNCVTTYFGGTYFGGVYGKEKVIEISTSRWDNHVDER